jgi:hypothetical protein
MSAMRSTLASRLVASRPSSSLGGTCSADRFRQGSGVTLATAGRLVSVSVNGAATTPIEVLSAAIPNRQIGVTTVGAIRRMGATVTPAPPANKRFQPSWRYYT